MKLKYLLLFFHCFSACHGWECVKTRDELKFYEQRDDTIMVCSPGRSGSTLVSDTLDRSYPTKIILKSHLLPPNHVWKGKIIYIFSNPDKAAESILHVSLQENSFWNLHFDHMETSDLNWLHHLGHTWQQTVENNLLCYDALGTEKHLRQWLRRGVQPNSMRRSCIIAVKYEQLWEEEVINTIKTFCGLDEFPLPQKVERGYRVEEQSEKERLIKSTYNLGTEQNPRYAAYDRARNIWKNAPKFQFFSLPLDK
jgi:hypothetical protein